MPAVQPTSPSTVAISKSCVSVTGLSCFCKDRRFAAFLSIYASSHYAICSCEFTLFQKLHKCHKILYKVAISSCNKFTSTFPFSFTLYLYAISISIFLNNHTFKFYLLYLLYAYSFSPRHFNIFLLLAIS